MGFAAFQASLPIKLDETAARANLHQIKVPARATPERSARTKLPLRREATPAPHATRRHTSSIPDFLESWQSTEIVPATIPIFSLAMPPAAGSAGESQTRRLRCEA